MSRLPRLDARTLIRILAREGFEVVRINGSHHFLRHADGRGTVVSMHAGETIGPGLLTKIMADCEMDRETLERLVRDL
ncbi:MAG: type II toxin-antitoxin system HicA family toxin [Deltaproteobacteria bacterium]|nr:type II toxin-antitoxin system HicA family toxin [Deltaproteobacteria bacterium]